MKRKRTEKTIADRKGIFYGFSLLGFAFSLFLIVKTDGEALKLFFYYYKDYFMDFFNHILYVRDPLRVYDSCVFATFPPLAYILYYILGKFIPPSILASEGGRALRDNLFGMNLYVAYTVVLTVFLLFLIQGLMKRKGRGEQLAVTLIVLLSAPFIGLYERGNSAFLVLIFLMAFALLRDSDRAWKRETALLCLAAATGFKLYPAVFGLLYLQEKRWGEAVRLTLYGVFLVFFPFVFFGGFGKIPVLLYNFQFITKSVIGQGDLRSVTYVVILIGERFGLTVPRLLALGQNISVLFFLFCCFCVLLQRVLWKKMVLLVGIMIFFPAWSGSYTVVYLTLPLILYMGGQEDGDGGRPLWNILYQLLFACVFTMMLWDPAWSKQIFHSEFAYTLRMMGAWGLVFLVAVDTLLESAGRLRRCRSKA